MYISEVIQIDIYWHYSINKGMMQYPLASFNWFDSIHWFDLSQQTARYVSSHGRRDSIWWINSTWWINSMRHVQDRCGWRRAIAGIRTCFEHVEWNWLVELTRRIEMNHRIELHHRIESNRDKTILLYIYIYIYIYMCMYIDTHQFEYWFQSLVQFCLMNQFDLTIWLNATCSESVRMKACHREHPHEFRTCRIELTRRIEVNRRIELHHRIESNRDKTIYLYIYICMYMYIDTHQFEYWFRSLVQFNLRAGELLD